MGREGSCGSFKREDKGKREGGRRRKERRENRRKGKQLRRKVYGIGWKVERKIVYVKADR